MQQISTDNSYSGKKKTNQKVGKKKKKFTNQFLNKRESDVGRSKSLGASAFINKRVYDTNVLSHNCPMQDKDKEWYEQFNIIICGLDSVPARRWINSTLFSMLGKKLTKKKIYTQIFFFFYLIQIRL